MLQKILLAFSLTVNGLILFAQEAYLAKGVIESNHDCKNKIDLMLLEYHELIINNKDEIIVASSPARNNIQEYILENNRNNFDTGDTCYVIIYRFNEKLYINKAYKNLLEYMENQKLYFKKELKFFSTISGKSLKISGRLENLD